MAANTKHRTGRRLTQGEVGRRSEHGQGHVQEHSKVGRPSTAEESGRYTRPIPKSVRRSPPWYGALVLILLLLGVAIIVVNYLAHIPGVAHGSPWGLVVGLVLIFAGFLMATRYR